MGHRALSKTQSFPRHTKKVVAFTTRGNCLNGDPHLPAVVANGLAEPELYVPNKTQASCSATASPSCLEDPEHPDEVWPGIWILFVGRARDVEHKSILSVVHGKSFGADLLVGPEERRLDKTSNAVCRWVFHERVSVDLVADLGGEEQEAKSCRCVLRLCQPWCLGSLG